MATWILVLSIMCTIAATVLAYIFIVPEKKRATMGKLAGLLHDIVNFKFLIIEKIMQFFYILATVFCVSTGFFMLFYVEQGYSGRYYSTPDQWYGGRGLLLMILGPIAVRIFYEFMMMLILLVKNVMQINNKLKSQNPDSQDVFAMPTKQAAPAPVAPAPVAPVAPVAPAPAAPVQKLSFCTRCGSKLDAQGNCPNCG